VSAWAMQAALKAQPASPTAGIPSFVPSILNQPKREIQLLIDEIFRAGIAAAKSGDLARAAVLFGQVVQADPHSEQGWLWLGFCCSASDRREYCFRRVLSLNPNNLEARSQLERLSEPSSKPPAWAVPPPVNVPKEQEEPRPARPVVTPSVGRSEERTVPPFLSEDARPHKPFTPSAPAVPAPQTLREELIAPEEKSAPAPAAKAAAKVGSPRPSEPKRKKPNNILIVLLGVAATLIVGGAAAAFFILSGGMIQWLPGNLAPIQAPLPPTALTTPPISLSPTTVSELPPDSPTPLPSPKPTVSYTPILEKVNCPFNIPAGANVSCSYVIVPEDRTGDPSHTIRLAVAVYHSTSSNPSPDPVLFLQGGPGGEAVKLSADAYDLLVAPFLAKRDFITFDQRGTGLSDPALKCDELTKAYQQDIEGLIPVTTRNLVYSNALVSCNGLMSAEGINLNAYTTVASAADVKDILSLLGYQKVDLYGASYGTRLAQVIMRDHPEIVQSVVLDSVVPVEANFFNGYPVAIQSALKTLFDNCAADPQCNAAYPNLETVFRDLLSQLDAKPVTLTTSSPRTGSITETVDGSTVMNIILGSMKQTAFIDTAPQSIYRFKNGDFSTLISAQASLPFSFQGISPGLYISMMCHEHVLATTPEELQSTAASSPKDIREYAWLPFYGSAEDIFRICKSWGATGPELGENAPVISDIPTLIITGKYDPTTPPMYAQQVAKHLSHSYYFEFPNQGHTPTAADSSGCAMSTVVSFLENPSVEPDRSCLNKMSGVQFLVPYTGTPPLSLKTVDAGGISAKVPEDWHPTGDGFYFRGESPIDITQAGVLEVNGSAAGVEAWFSSKAYGYRGLDTALVQAGQRQANGLAWTLYTTTSYGRPVDIAMADYRGQSLVVMSFCNNDEHDAIYRTVFLPMVDSVQP
jgi:pimeloyl-ACP methyl ester carboxylesterase